MKNSVSAAVLNKTGSPSVTLNKSIRLFSATRCKNLGYMPNYSKGKKMQKLLSHFAKHSKLSNFTHLKTNLGNVSNQSLNDILSILESSNSPHNLAQSSGLITPTSDHLRPIKLKPSNKFSFGNYIPIPRTSFSEEAHHEAVAENKTPMVTSLYNTVNECPVTIYNEYDRQIKSKDDLIEQLKQKIATLEEYIELQGTFKVQELLTEIEKIKNKEKYEQNKVIESYESAFNYLKFYNIHTEQQKAFVKYLCETERLQNENLELRNKLSEFKKYMLSQAQSTKVSDILNKLTGKIAPSIETHYIKFNKFTTKIHKTSSINEYKQLWNEYYSVINSLKTIIKRLEYMLEFRDFIGAIEKASKAGEENDNTNGVAKAKDMVYMALFELQNLKPTKP